MLTVSADLPADAAAVIVVVPAPDGTLLQRAIGSKESGSMSAWELLRFFDQAAHAMRLLIENEYEAERRARVPKQAVEAG